MQQDFVRRVIAGASRADAYLATHPLAQTDSAGTLGAKLAANTHVRAAINLGRREIAHEVALATKHDVQAAFVELGEIMNEARAGDQFTAAVKAAETRAKLTGALVDRVESKNVGGFVFRIEGLPEQGRVIEVTPTTEEKADGD